VGSSILWPIRRPFPAGRLDCRRKSSARHQQHVRTLLTQAGFSGWIWDGGAGDVDVDVGRNLL